MTAKRVATRTSTAKKATKKKASTPGHDVRAVLAALQKLGNARTREEMGPRYGIHAKKAFGVPVGKIRQLAKKLGQNHALALALWKTGWYEARLLASFVDEPERVTPAQMDAWCRDFDNWGVVDTVCFALFDRSPHAFKKVAAWAKQRGEYQKRAAFALLACLALHGRGEGDAPYLKLLPLIEKAAADERNFVKKGVSWALRAIGQRSAALNAAAVAMAKRLTASTDSAAQWVGRDALRDITRPAVLRRVKTRR